jgi:CRISPR-associated protein Cas6
VGSRPVAISTPTRYLLAPHESLYSRMVNVRNQTEPNSFYEFLNARLDEMGIKARTEPVVMDNRQVFKGLRIKDCRVIGFPVVVRGLTDAESIKLQIHGLGGRRRFGCGIFLPLREERQHGIAG